jgi:hypothetical protein
MATRMQQRRGTAAQWISTNAGAGPVLNAGEIGWESDTNKFKIGDGVNNWTSLDYFADINSTVNPAFGTSITFEGATADSYETILQVTDPTADRTITLPNVTGTVITTGNLSDITDIGVFTSTIVMEGSTADAHELTLSAGDPTADRTITFPDATGTVALTSDITVTASSTNTLSNKSISLGSNTVTSTLAQLNTAISDADVATLTGAETLTNKTLTTPVISSITNGAATLTLPTSTGTIALTSDIAAGIVTETGTQTLTNKTLTSPVITGAVFNDGSIVFEGATANDFETTITVTDPTADRTITLPDATGTVALTNNKLDVFAATTSSELRSVISDETGTGGLVFADTPTLITPNIGAATGTSLVLSGDLTVNGTTTTINSTTLAVDDKNITLGDVETPTDTTADGGGITLKGATDKTFNWVDSTDSWTSSEHINLASGKSYYMNGTALKDVSETLTNKTLTTPVISSISNTGTLTLPTSTDTLVGRATTDTLTNKSISLGSNTITSTLAELNTAVSDADLASLAGSETLTNKTLASAVATTALTLNATAELRLADTDSTHYVGFKSPGTVTSNKVWVLPAADGTAGQALSTDGSGNLSWATSGGGAAFSEFMLIGA